MPKNLPNKKPVGKNPYGVSRDQVVVRLKQVKQVFDPICGTFYLKSQYRFLR